jgi:uncharacterized DUF497 family protein
MRWPYDSWNGFDWDEGNSNKNWHRHRVSDGECEEPFFNVPLILAADPRRYPEERFLALGRTDSDRWLYIAFTIRNRSIRVISARDMTKNEVRKYEEKIKRDPGV